MTTEAVRATEVFQQDGVRQALGQYINSERFSGGTLSRDTRLAYCGDLAQFEKFCQNHDILPMNALTQQDIGDWLKEMKEEKGYARATIDRKRSSLSGFLDWAQTEGLIRPDFTISLPKSEPVGKKHRPILSAEQVDSLISKTKNLRDASLILIALTTGASVKEIVNLNVEDILRTGDGNIAIRFKGIVKRVQSRTLEVDKKAGSKIAEYIGKSGLKPKDPLFKGRKGHRWLIRQGFNFMLNGYAPKIGMQNLNPRMLRNTFIANFAGTARQLDAILGKREPEPARSTYFPRRLLKI